MTSFDQIQAVRFHNVEFSTEYITLFSRQSKLLSIEKKDVQKITMKYGFQSERPVIQFIFGIALIVAGLYFIVNFFLRILVYRVADLDFLLSLLLLPLGGWFIVDGSRKRYYFEVLVENDKRKFPLGTKPNKDELKKFLSSISQLGYIIDANIIEH